MEAKFTLTELWRTIQFPSEDLDAYVKRVHERALVCCFSVAENVLVDVDIRRILEEYVVRLETLSFTSFLRLMEIVRRMNYSVKKSLRYNSVIRPSLKKWNSY